MSTKYTRHGLTIVKRGPKYSTRIRFRGKVHQLTLCDTVEESFKAALLGRREIQAGHWEALRAATSLRAPEKSATLDELYTAYLTGPARASRDTREQNICALKGIIGETAATVADLTPVAIRAWFTARQQAILQEPDQEQAASLRRSANSKWRKARSIFRQRCLAHYQDSGLAGIGGLAAFVAAGDSAKFEKIPKIAYNPPSQEIIARTLADWLALEDRDLFLAIGHELAFGLRIAEFSQARWDWHREQNGYPVLDGRATVKNGSGVIQVRALDPYFSQMIARATEKEWWPKAGTAAAKELIIQGTDAYREDGLFRAVSDWLRTRGWLTRKTNHALRAYAGSQVAMRYGIYEAQMFLRHSTVKVTEQNYSHFVAKFKPANIESIPAKWAVAHSLHTPCHTPASLNPPQSPTIPITGTGIPADYAVTQGGLRGSTAFSDDAKAVGVKVSAVAQQFERSQALFGVKTTAISQLRAISIECAAAGWDGGEASAINPVAVLIAENFVRALPIFIPLPEFAPEPDGSVSLDWLPSRHRMFSISVGNNNRLAYAWLDGTNKGHAVERFDGYKIPQRIVEGISAILSNGNTSVRTA